MRFDLFYRFDQISSIFNGLKVSVESGNFTRKIWDLSSESGDLENSQRVQCVYL